MIAHASNQAADEAPNASQVETGEPAAYEQMRLEDHCPYCGCIDYYRHRALYGLPELRIEDGRLEVEEGMMLPVRLYTCIGCSALRFQDETRDPASPLAQLDASAD